MDLTSPTEIKRIMNGLGRDFNKSLGQNFLIDSNVLQTTVMASGIDENYGVLEIGPGIGTLTVELAKNAGKVCAIELDRTIYEYLTKAFVFNENVKFIQGDALKLDLATIIKEEFGNMPCVIVANLPYYITTPLIMKFLEDGLNLESITVMVQKEVALRMAADCGTKDYGALSLAVSYYSDAQIIDFVPPESFLPPPKVTSAVIKLDIKNHIKPDVKDKKELFRVIKASFAQRRKILINGLSAAYPCFSKEFIRDTIEKICGNPNIRGEQLNLSQFIVLSDIFYEKKNSNIS